MICSARSSSRSRWRAIETFSSHIPILSPRTSDIPSPFDHAYTSDEACANLASLKFSQSNRAADLKDPTRIITTTTTTTFSMSRDMAKGICQHFMDGRLIENAADIGSTTFKDRGVYTTTPKGLHMLERFITKNGIAADHVLRLFADQPITMKVLHLERRTSDDEVMVTPSVTSVIWKRFTGKEPNVCMLSEDDIQAQMNSRWYAKSSISPGTEFDREIGILLRKNPIVASERKSVGLVDDYTFPATSAVDWLCEFSTAAGPDEAGDILAQFVRYGFLQLHSDKGKPRDSDMIFTARAGCAGGGAGAMMVSIESGAGNDRRLKLTSEQHPRRSTRSPRKVSSLRNGTFREPLDRRPMPRSQIFTLQILHHPSQSLDYRTRLTTPRYKVHPSWSVDQVLKREYALIRLITRQRIAIQQDSDRFSMNRPCDLSLESSCAKTFAKKICPSGSILRISSESLRHLRLPPFQEHPRKGRSPIKRWRNINPSFMIWRLSSTTVGLVINQPADISLPRSCLSL